MKMFKTRLVCLMSMVLSIIILQQNCSADAKIHFDQGIGFYYVSDGKAHFLYWTKSSSKTLEERKKNLHAWAADFLLNRYNTIPQNTKYYSYGLDISNTLPPHLSGYGFAYIDSTMKAHGDWAVRFIPVYGYEEKVYEIVFEGPYEEIKNNETPYLGFAFIVPRGGVGQDAFLFRFETDSK